MHYPIIALLRGSHGLSARRAWRTLSSRPEGPKAGPKGRNLEVGARRAPRLLYLIFVIFLHQHHFQLKHLAPKMRKLRHNWFCEKKNGFATKQRKSFFYRSKHCIALHFCGVGNGLVVVVPTPQLSSPPPPPPPLFEEFFDTRLIILTPAPHVVQVTNMRYEHMVQGVFFSLVPP